MYLCTTFSKIWIFSELVVYKTWVGNVHKHHLITGQEFWLLFTIVPPESCCPGPPWLYDCSEHRLDAQALRLVLIAKTT